MNEKSVEVLISTMDQSNKCENLVRKMNVQTKSTICNQADEYDIYQETNKLVITNPKRGVGLSRNTTLLYSDSEICLIADDDMIFQDNYEKKIKHLFLENSNADVIILGLKSDKDKNNGKVKSINRFNYKKYGAARFAFKRESIIKNNIYFSLLFGGGAKYGSGEDTLFLKDCLQKKLRIIKVDFSIAELTDERESTWFEGYNDKFFFDKGALYYAINPHLYLLNILQFSIRKANLSSGEIGIFKAMTLMYRGAQAYKKDLDFDRYNYKEMM